MHKRKWRKMNYKAICFDFDYTLADCTDSIVDGFHYGFDQLGYPRAEREAIRLTVGLMLEDAFISLTGEHDPEIVAKFRPLFIEAAMERQRQETVLCEGGEALLRSLHGMGVKLGIVSSKRGDTISYIMNRLGVANTLSLVIGSENVAVHKPNPEGILEAMRRMEVDPSEVLYCGDTVIDAEAAQRAGVSFAAVMNGTTKAEAFEAFPHVAICENLPQLGQFLGANMQNS